MSTNGFSRGAVVLAAGICMVSGVASLTHAQDAKEQYDKSCKMCHGASGKGDGPGGKMLKPPPADFGTVLKGKPDAEIAKVIKEGGKAAGLSAAMPAYNGKLSDDQINSLVQLVKGFAGK